MKKWKSIREFRANPVGGTSFNDYEIWPTEIWHCNGRGDLTFVSFHGTTIANLSNETRFRVERIRVLILSSFLARRVNRRSSIKILPGCEHNVRAGWKRNWSRLISKLDASSNAFSRGLQLTGRNNADSFNPVRQRVLKDGPSAIGHEMKRIYGNYKVYRLRQSPSSRVMSSIDRENRN